MEFLVVCPLALLAGFVDAVAGGGGLVSLPAFLFAGIPVHQAIGTNKLSSCLGTTASAWRFFKNGYMVRHLAVAGVACGLAGSFAGSNLAMLVDDDVIKLFMLAALPVAAFYVLRTKNLDRYEASDLPPARAAALTAVIALAVGVYDGFYGPGTGTFLILLLTSVGHLGLREANGTTKAINLATNLAALAVFLANGVVLLPLGLAAGAFNVAGNLLGAHFFRTDGSRITRPVVLAVLALFAVRLATDLLA